MRDKGIILAGTAVFLGLIAFPVWHNLGSGKSEYRPDIQIRTKNVAGKDRCVMPVEYMRTSHMNLLNEWRDQVVRNDQRDYTSPDGRHFQRSLTGTCLDCHSNKSAFCDRCHDYASVKPACWDCHVAPKEDAR
jgi:hypothetical protein